MSTIQTELADEKQKSEESVALVKQKEEDIKVIFTRKRNFYNEAVQSYFARFFSLSPESPV